MATTQARMRLSIFSLIYSGSIAGTVTRKVTAPEPSRWTIAASTAVPRVMRAGWVPTIFRMRLTIGSSMPASVRIPKNRMANSSMPATGAIALMPSVMKVPISAPKPPISAVSAGIAISATSADIFLPRMTNSRAKIVRKPRKASMKVSNLLYVLIDAALEAILGGLAFCCKMDFSD